MPERVLGIVMDDTEAWNLARSLQPKRPSSWGWRSTWPTSSSGATTCAAIACTSAIAPSSCWACRSAAADLSAAELRDVGAPRRPSGAACQPGAGRGQRPAGGRGDALPPCRRRLAPCADAPRAATRRPGRGGGAARRRPGPERARRKWPRTDRADAPVRADHASRRHRLLVCRGRDRPAALERADLRAARPAAGCAGAADAASGCSASCTRQTASAVQQRFFDWVQARRPPPGAGDAHRAQRRHDAPRAEPFARWRARRAATTSTAC